MEEGDLARLVGFLIGDGDRFDDTASNTPLYPQLPQLRSLNETLTKKQRYDVDIQTGKKLVSPRGNLYKDSTKR